MQTAGASNEDKLNSQKNMKEYSQQSLYSRSIQSLLEMMTQRMDKHQYNLFLRTIPMCGEQVDSLDSALMQLEFPVISRLQYSFGNSLKALGSSSIIDSSLAFSTITTQIRQRWIDAQILQSLADGIKQVVVLYGGYDSRGFLLRDSDVKWIDVDLPQVQRKKQLLFSKVLKDTQDVPVVDFASCDFREERLAEVLDTCKFDTNARTLVIMEDVLSYLMPSEVVQLMIQVSEITVPGSRLYCDFVHQKHIEKQSNTGVSCFSLGSTANFCKFGLQPNFGYIRSFFKQVGFHPFVLKLGKELLQEFIPQNQASRKEPVHDVACHLSFVGLQRGVDSSPKSSPTDSPKHSPRESLASERHATLNLALSKFGYIDDI